MRFILILKSSPHTESGEVPSTEVMEAMMSFYASMNSAGVVLSADGLHASSKDSARVAFSPSGPSTVTPGPFTPPETLVAGFWIIKVKDLEEALEWAKKCPLKEDATIEVRRIVELDDFGENVTEGIRSDNERLRRETEERVQGKGGEYGGGGDDGNAAREDDGRDRM
jgi:hypothetical protein